MSDSVSSSKSRVENRLGSFLRWLPVTGSVTLMAMVAFVSVMNLAALKDAAFWRKHTFDVILAAQAFEENVIDIQRGVRGYLALGDTNALATYHHGIAIEPGQYDRLVELTRDNPQQQQRLKDLAAAMVGILRYDEGARALRDKLGAKAELKLDSNPEGRTLFGNVRDIVRSISQAEQVLLADREAVETAESNNVRRLLIFGSLLAAVLLVLANAMASRELGRRKRIESRLRDISTLQNAILNSASHAIIALEPNGIVRTFNPAAERLLGYTAAEIIGKATPMLWRDQKEVAAQAEKLSRELGRAIKPGIDIITARPTAKKADEFEVTYIRKDGSRVPVQVSLTALGTESGASAGFLGVIADITKRKAAEAALRESEERFRSAFDDAPIGMALVSPEGRWLKVNHALCNMLGYTAEKLLATDVKKLTHPDDQGEEEEYLREILEGEISSYQFEKRCFHSNGETVSVKVSASLVRDHDSHPLYLVTQIENISERRQYEAERDRMIADLQSMIAQVKTLSGMIPICGWCKNIRSDEGYWESVEQYVHHHTDATFSHGMCPTCAEKFKADLQKHKSAAAAPQKS